MFTKGNQTDVCQHYAHVVNSSLRKTQFVRFDCHVTLSCSGLFQIAELQTEVTDLRIKLESALKEKENIIEGGHAEVAEVTVHLHRWF